MNDYHRRSDFRHQASAFSLLKSYVPQPDDVPIDESRIKMRVTELGKDIVDGHPCVKNKSF